MEPYIISALSALLGALIPTVATVVIQLQQPRMDREKVLFDIQKDVLHEYLDALQSMINASNDGSIQIKKGIEGLMRATNKAALYVDCTTAEHLVDYRDAVFSGRLTETQHAKFQSDILNSMRKNIGLSSIRRFKVIGNHLPDE